MKYDFTTVPNRVGTNAEKFCNMLRKDPTVPDDIVPFSVADMDFLPPPELISGLQEMMANTIFGYTLPKDSYYESVLNWCKRRHGLDLPREWLVDADNVIAALRQMIRAFSEPGDGIIVFTPAYPAFPSAIAAEKRNMVVCPLHYEDNRYTIDYAALEELCAREDTRMLVFCNPHNPVGRAWSKPEIQKTAEICLKHNIFIVSDEIHWDIILPGASFSSMLELDEKYLKNCAVSTACTKTFNIAAMKGAAVFMADEARRARYHELDGVSGRDLISFAACEIAYNTCEAWADELLLVLDSNRRLMKEFLTERIPEVGIIPLEATYLQWLDFRFLGLNAQELEDFMAFRARCFFTEGYKFNAGGAGFERWDIACPQSVLLAGLERMEKAVKEFHRS